MNKKVIIAIIAAVLVVVAIGVVYFVYSNNGYSVYSSAFKKTFNVNSIELETSVEASVDGSNIESTGSFKLKDMNTTPQFINTMTISGQTITQFCDGEYIYTDDGQNKNKIKMGETPTVRQEKENTSFSYDSYISEFSSLLDASKIKELNSLEPVAEKYVDKIEVKNTTAGKRYEVTLLPQAVDEMVDTIISENISNPDLAPTVALQSMTYQATVNNGYVSKILFHMVMDVTAPNETEAKSATVDFTIVPVNPGKAVDFTLPSTEGY